MRRVWRIDEDTLAALPESLSESAHQTVTDLKGNVWSVADEVRKALREANPHLDTRSLNVIGKVISVPDLDAEPLKAKKGGYEPDPDLRDQENIPLPAGWLSLDERARHQALVAQADKYLEVEIQPYLPDAWIDHTKTKIGYEIPFTRHFYQYTPPRPVAEIDSELRAVEAEIQELLRGLAR